MFEVTEDDLAFFFETVIPHLNERQRRVTAGAFARALGHGGVRAISVASGMSLGVVQKGARDVDEGIEPSDRVRAEGAGRKLAEVTMPGIDEELDSLVEPESRGDPECELRWTTKSTRTLANELTKRGFPITHSVVAKMLGATGYSLQGASKVVEGGSHPDRDAQFQYIAKLVREFREAGEPVASIDAKKKEPAPRGALSYPRFSREEFEGTFCPMANSARRCSRGQQHASEATGRVQVRERGVAGPERYGE
jgi:transposase